MGTSRKSKVIVLSVGGGGLLAGVAAYAKTGQIGQLAVHSRIKWVLNHDGTMGWWNVLCFITELILLKNMNVFLFSESFNPYRGLPACRLPCNARICESRWHFPWERFFDTYEYKYKYRPHCPMGQSGDPIRWQDWVKCCFGLEPLSIETSIISRGKRGWDRGWEHHFPFLQATQTFHPYGRS